MVNYYLKVKLKKNYMIKYVINNLLNIMKIYHMNANYYYNKC